MSANDATYFGERAAAEKRLARDAAEPHIREIHLRIAKSYEQKAAGEDDGFMGMVRDHDLPQLPIPPK